MRKKILCICAVLWVFALYQMIVNYEAEREPDIINAFTDNMYLDISGRIKSVAFYGNRYMKEEEKKELIEEVAESLGIQKPYTIEEEEDGKKLTLTKLGKKVVTAVSLITEETSVDKKVLSQKQYLTIEMTVDNSIESTVYYQEQIRKLMSEMDMGADIYTTIMGSVEGELGNSEKNAVADRILENMNGKVVTENRSSDMFTIYAYSDKIDDYVVYGSTKMNINVVITYNDITGRTEVYMSTPIMNEDF